jgi:hypothetical protein
MTLQGPKVRINEDRPCRDLLSAASTRVTRFWDPIRYHQCRDSYSSVSERVPSHVIHGQQHVRTVNVCWRTNHPTLQPPPILKMASVSPACQRSLPRHLQSMMWLSRLGDCYPSPDDAPSIPEHQSKMRYHTCEYEKSDPSGPTDDMHFPTRDRCLLWETLGSRMGATQASAVTAVRDHNNREAVPIAFQRDNGVQQQGGGCCWSMCVVQSWYTPTEPGCSRSRDASLTSTIGCACSAVDWKTQTRFVISATPILDSALPSNFG